MGKLIPKLYEDGAGIDTIIAHNIREARKFYREECDGDPDAAEDLERIDSKDFDRKEVWWMFSSIAELREYHQKFGQLTVGIWGGELAVLLTYKQALEVYSPDNIPGVFSSTEW